VPKFTLAFALIGCSVAAFGQIPGSIAGITADSVTGKPLAGVFVTAVRSGLPPLARHATSDITGIYLLPDLPAGTYTVCAHYPGDGYLDPCAWSSIPQTINLAAGQVLAEKTIKLIPGSVVQVRINDPGQLLSTSAADLALGVRGSRNIFYPAHMAVTDSGGASYQLTIPLDTLVSLEISSGHLKLGDAAGSALPGNSLRQKFQHKTGDANPQAFTFAVTGAAQ
jgi:hypothetical protein